MNPMDRSMAFAREFDQTHVAFWSRSFEEFEQAFMKLESKWVSSSEDWEALEVRRRIAEALFTEAYSRNLDWPRFSNYMERIRALGFTDFGRQAHVAILFARWAHRHQEHEPEARQALDQAEQLVVQADPQNPMTQDLKASIAKVRADTGYRSGGAAPA